MAPAGFDTEGTHTGEPGKDRSRHDIHAKRTNECALNGVTDDFCIRTNRRFRGRQTQALRRHCVPDLHWDVCNGQSRIEILREQPDSGGAEHRNR
jgi:hypothetical protein